MANTGGKAYALTTLAPIKNGMVGQTVFADEVRNRLRTWRLNENSPLARVPQTYFARFFVLDDVFYASTPGSDAVFNFSDILSLFSDKFRIAALPHEDHLKSKYLVFSSDFHGDPDSYLGNMWNAISDEIKSVWEYCYAFDKVQDAPGFIDYMKKCQLTANLFFVGSTDDSLEEQLKALYLKQELAKFAVDHQGQEAAELQQAFKAFIQRVQPDNLAGPSWKPGQSSV